MELSTVLTLFLFILYTYNCFATDTDVCREGDKTLESTLQKITNDLVYVKECIQSRLNTNPSMAVDLKRVIETEERNLQNEMKALKKVVESSLPQPSGKP